MKRNSVVAAAAVAASLASSIVVPAAHAQATTQLPAVKTSASNKVPECATPGRMMAMISERNKSLDPRYADIATAYMRHGEAIGVRWDYAFFQMILETGSLAYKRGNGKPGDVKPSQNNFAGLGATGGGEPGEKFASIDDGVRAHLQHLQMYSGETVENPVAERTRNVQQWGVLTSWQKGFKRPITFADVAGKWAPGSRGYVGDMKSIASDFYDDFCNKADPRPDMVREARVGGGTPTRTAKTAKAETVDYARQANERARAEGSGARSSLGAKAVGSAKASAAPAAPSAPSATTAGFKVLNEQAEAAPAVEKPGEILAEIPAENPTAKPIQIAAAAAMAAPGAAVKGAKAQPPSKAAATPAATAAAVGLAKPPATPQAATPTKCRVFTASYGGQKAVIIRASADSFTNFTVLDVNDGQETREVEAYISTYAKGGQKVGAFSSSNAALEEAFKLCPEG